MSKFFKLKVVDVKKETEDTVSVAFEISDENKLNFNYQSGQYLTLKTIINNQEIRRSYSLSSASFENEWRVAIKQVQNGKFSTFANNELKVGDTIESMPPDGLFKIETKFQNQKQYLLICAGSGITPIISIAKSILKLEPNSQVTLIYGNQSPEQTIFKSEIDFLAKSSNQMKLHYIYSKKKIEHCGFGRISTSKVKKILSSNQIDKIDDIYVCGPEEMIFDIKDGFENDNILKNKVHFELFTSPTKKDSDKKDNNKSEVNQLSQVTVIVDDEEFEFEMKSTDGFVLDKAQEEGADVPFACKGGVCCTCKAKVIEGEVSMDLNYALEPEEVKEGYVLTCQARPVSEVVVISFDE